MAKRTALLAIVVALLIGGWAGWFAHGRAVVSNKVIDPLSVAREYAAAHYPPHTFQPKGAPLAFQVEEHGDFWTVHLAPQGYVGGGLQLMIRRQDGRVISAMRSQ